MRLFKSIFSVLGALVPIVYCVGLIYYFLDGTGSLEDAKAIGLGPTLLGLAVVGLLFVIPLVWRIMRIITAPRAPTPGGRNGDDAPTRDGTFDPDAAVARYMAQRSAEGAPASSATSTAHKSDGPPRPTFGRKVK
jgi:hypothetical protein